MKYLVKKAEIKQYDANTSKVFGIPPLVLIERAALAATEEIERDGLRAGSRVVIAVGTGNNGADGIAIGRLLHLKGYQVFLVLCLDRTRATAENKKELEIAQNYKIATDNAAQWLQEKHTSEQYDLFIDALFGVGLSRSIEGEAAKLIECLNDMSGKKVAIDIPSGIDADNGQVLGVAFQANLTVTFSYEKLGMRLCPGIGYCGRIVCRSVGIDDHSFLAESELGHAPRVAAYTREDLSLLPPRRMHTNKGSYGKVLVIAGSVNMAGAAIFSAKAAYLCGCGLVRVFTPEENRTILQGALPEAVLTTYSAKKWDADSLNASMQWADVIVCGPGIGSSDTAKKIVHTVLKNAAVPLVLDADALNIISEDTEILRRPHTELILTPHLGEMSRLNHMPISYLQEHLLESAEEFSRTYNLICVLKDAVTITAIPYGQTIVNLSGNNGMATGGSGDVLTGVIASLLAQGLAPKCAAALGVYMHGCAGDAAAKRYGQYSLMATALLEALPDILRD